MKVSSLRAPRTAAAAGQLRLDAFLPYRLSVASNAVSRLISTAYAERFGISIPEWRIIAVLRELGPASQQDLVARTLMDKVTVSRAAQSMDRRGLIRRLPDPDDGRARRVALTPSGERLHAEVAPMALRLEQELLGGVSDREAELLLSLLVRLQDAADRIAAGET
jgi:DNA-binding MarR family transcriptional regulator